MCVLQQIAKGIAVIPCIVETLLRTTCDPISHLIETKVLAGFGGVWMHHQLSLGQPEVQHYLKESSCGFAGKTDALGGRAFKFSFFPT